MKNNTLLILLGFLIFASSCKKEKVVIYEPGDKENGCVTALKNGEDFSASSFVGFAWEGANKEGLSINFVTYDEDGVIREIYGFSVPRKIGMYTTPDYEINDLMSISGSSGYYDERVIVYEMDKIKDNYVHLQSLDLIEMKVEGTFEIFLKRVSGRTEGYPQKLSFKNGHFISTIIQ